ncbi:MAG: AzlD family protein [Candidatus Competibacterales bacterium]
MDSPWPLIIALATGTFAIRLAGCLLGARLPSEGPWARGFNALPGCLIAALLTVLLAQGSFVEWLASALALGTAVLTRNLLLTMAVGIGAVWLLRNGL